MQYKPTNLAFKLAAVVVVDLNNAIGKDGGLLVHLPNDLKHFKNITTNHIILMGRRTYESLPHGALPNRTNIVITSDNPKNYPGCIVASSVEEAFKHCEGADIVYNIGGGQLFTALQPLTNILHLTRIDHSFAGADTYFPEIDFSQWVLVSQEDHSSDEKHKYAYSFQKYIRK